MKLPTRKPRYFRRKPLVIKVEQYLPGEPLPRGVSLDAQGAYVDSPEGKMRFIYYDYVITGVFDEQYPCRREFFEHTYEEVF